MNSTHKKAALTKSSGRVAGKTIIVTAGYGDIGRATCRRLCQEGARVIMTGRKPLDEGGAIARQTQTGPGTMEYLRCDASDRSSIDAMLAEVVRRHGRIDGDRDEVSRLGRRHPRQSNGWSASPAPRPDRRFSSGSGSTWARA